METTLIQLFFIFAGSFLGAAGGAFISNRAAWRQHFVTREELFEFAREIDARLR